MANFTDNIIAKSSSSIANSPTQQKGHILFGIGEGDYGPANPDLVGFNDTGFRNSFFATGSGSFTTFEIPINATNYQYSNLSGTGDSANPPDGEMTVTFTGDGNPTLEKITFSEHTTEASGALATIRKDNPPLAVINLEQDNSSFAESSISGSYLVTFSQLINTNDTRLNVTTQWVSSGTFQVDKGPINVTIVTSSVDLYNSPTLPPSTLISYFQTNRDNLINFFKTTRTAFNVNTLTSLGNYPLPCTASTIQNVLDQTTGDRNFAILAATDFEDVGLTIEPYNPFPQGVAASSADAGNFYQLYDYNTSHEIISACSYATVFPTLNIKIARPYIGTKIITIDPTDNQVADLVAANTAPDQFSLPDSPQTPAGMIIQSNKPISFSSQLYAPTPPTQLCGKILAAYLDRNYPVEILIFFKYNNTDLTYFRDKIGDDFQASFTRDRGDVLTLGFTSTDFQDRWVFLSATKDIVGIARARGANPPSTQQDQYILPVATIDNTPVYRRRNTGAFSSTLLGNTPSTNTTHVVSDPEGVVTVIKGDGAGDDAESGMSVDFLKNTYTFGNGKLYSYDIVSGYNQTVTSYYLQNTPTPTWIEYDAHTFSGASITNPAHHQEGEDDGTGDPLYNSSTVWKWEGSDPFYLVTNNGSDKEEAHLGWNRDATNIGISY